jgi:hypothetical protein
MVAKGCAGGAKMHDFAQRFPMLRRVRRLASVVVLIGALGLVSCGEGDEQEGVEDLLNQAFSEEIHSADLSLESEIELNGLLEDPIRIEAEGPFITNEDMLPSADIELRIGSGGGGQTITSGVLTTGDRAFLKFQDVYYEQPPEQVRETNRMIRRNSRRNGDSLGELGLDPRSWLVEATDEGDADVAGVETSHVSGTLDVDTLMRDLNDFVSRSASALGAGEAPPQLTAEDIRELSAAVKDPTFDVYVGKKDHLIRRISGRVEFEIPEANREDLGGLRGGTITFSVELRDVNGDQEIEAPARSRPLSRLTDSLGGGALEGLGTGGGAPEEPVPEDGESPETDEFRRYEECLDKARPEDTEALQLCADILKE